MAPAPHCELQPLGRGVRICSRKSVLLAFLLLVMRKQKEEKRKVKRLKEKDMFLNLSLDLSYSSFPSFKQGSSST